MKVVLDSSVYPPHPLSLSSILSPSKEALIPNLLYLKFLAHARATTSATTSHPGTLSHSLITVITVHTVVPINAGFEREHLLNAWL